MVVVCSLLPSLGSLARRVLDREKGKNLVLRVLRVIWKLPLISCVSTKFLNVVRNAEVAVVVSVAWAGACVVSVVIPDSFASGKKSEAWVVHH